MTRWSLPRLLLQAEGATLLIAAAAAFWALGGSWTLFAVLILAPDVCFLAFLGGRRAGTIAYNVAHAGVLPLALAAVALLAAERASALVALVWLAHIGMDRALGLGLKYVTHPKDTHFGRL